jgi:endonuclease/exonuclease/phosphatase family metal-dependent hydrolase
MATIRVATFNVENLFARWKFDKGVDPDEANQRGWIVEEAFFDELGKEDKSLTARAIKEIDADVLCFQEVENVETLKKFRTDFLGGISAYEYVAGVDGNDLRLIDVAVLSKRPITRIRTHQHLRNKAGVEVFSRDCLEVDVDVDGTPVTLFANHFKSMINTREETRPKRELQAAEARKIIEGRFGPNPGSAKFIVLGDLNDYPEEDDQGKSGLTKLVEWDQVENVIDRITDPEDRWTHYWAKGNDYKQLDYLLLSKSLAEASDGLPEIMRKGAPKRATRYPGPHFDGVGHDRPKASDHCPMVMEIAV